MNQTKEQENIRIYISINGDLLADALVRSMMNYRHHGDINTLFHSVYVSYCVLKMCRALHVEQTREIVRAALLHDFYLYEWYTEKHEQNHIWYHPGQSVINVEKYIGSLSDKQKNMILSHMFPLTKTMPDNIGAWLLTIADKYCASQDYLSISSRFNSVYDEIVKRTQSNDD